MDFQDIFVSTGEVFFGRFLCLDLYMLAVRMRCRVIITTIVATACSISLFLLVMR
ncbi:hypothetical protein SAMN05660226_02104 [Parapedobacter luteus]|uniref:Uncharacterized protein n=1 Tax=Parapedobacter luteus TaxID=623280 RepID=A0A1T5CE60_9SPHI|nr:hypothetical protein SAMN05660226_02104 [Parapedobacter luteus]